MSPPFPFYTPEFHPLLPDSPSILDEEPQTSASLLNSFGGGRHLRHCLISAL